MANNTSSTNFDDTSSQDGHPPTAPNLGSSPAASLMRQKLARLYSSEPDTGQELAEAQGVGERSKHQQFMYDLGASGKSLAVIQTEWHTYYQGLPPDEKNQVWQEFYSSQSDMTHQPPSGGEKAQKLASHKQEAAKSRKLRDARSAKDVQAAIRDTVTAGGKLEAKHHLQSLIFGLGMGLIVLIIFLFGFFNEVAIAPFIQPSRVTASTPLIVNSDSVAPSATPEVIIPKINVQIPVDYTQTSTNESIIENALESGVVHYPTTAKPGQIGNTAIFGHSSNNIFNKGKYKFAFVLLHTLVPGDTFYLTYNGKVYAYKVITKQVVEPSNVGVLNPVAGQPATATLITCDPPGTSLRRLVVVGQQISPDPSGNSEVATTPSVSAPTANLPGNGPTLWGRFIKTSTGKAVVVVITGAAALFGIRKINKRVTRIVN